MNRVLILAFVVTAAAVFVTADDAFSPDEILVEDAWTQVEMIATEKKGTHLSPPSAALMLRHIADLRAYAMAARDKAVDFKENPNADTGVVSFITEFGKVLSYKNPHTGKKIVKNFVLQYADSIAESEKIYSSGLGEYLVGHLNKAVLKGSHSSPLETFKDKRGNMVAIDYKALGLSHPAVYLKKLAVPLSKYLELMEEIKGVAGSADSAAAAIWLRDGKQEDFQTFYDKEAAKRNGLVRQGNEDVVNAARDAIAKHIDSIKKTPIGVTDLGKLAAEGLKGAAGAKTPAVPTEEEIKKKADAAAKAWAEKHKTGKKIEAYKEVNKLEDKTPKPVEEKKSPKARKEEKKPPKAKKEEKKPPKAKEPKPIGHGFIGCYKDNKHRDLKHGPKKYGYTATSCMSACKKYKFVALQNGGWCNCDNSYHTPAGEYPKKPEADCNKGGVAPGRGKGGAWANAVYTNKEYKPTLKIKVRTGTLDYAESSMHPKVTVVGEKGTFTGTIKIAGKGHEKVTTFNPPKDLGKITSVSFHASNTNGWLLDKLYVMSGDLKWVSMSFDCLPFWLDGKPYDKASSYGHVAYGDKLTVKKGACHKPKLTCTQRKSVGTGNGWSKVKAPGGEFTITGGGFQQKNTGYNKAAGVEQFSFDKDTYVCDSGFGAGSNDCFGIYCKGKIKLQCQTKSCRVNRKSKTCTARLDKGYVMTGGGLVNHYRSWNKHSQFEQSRPEGNNGWLSDMGFGWGDFTSTVRGCKGLSCVTEVSKQGDATHATCPSGYTLTGCGIKNDYGGFNKKSLFEYVKPDVAKNKCWCNMGSGIGQDKCYARCCKLA
jgi:hypothetical protein